MNAIDIEKLNQLISRNDISGNDKVRWLTDFIDGRELQLIRDEFYSEEELLQALNLGFTSTDETWEQCVAFAKEQFKKK